MLQKITSPFLSSEVILINITNNNYGDYMKICKQDCIYQNNGICYKEKIAPINNNSICADFIEKSENNINSFPDILNRNDFN